MASKLLFAPLAAVVLSLSVSAHAAGPNAADRETARSLMQQGRDARTKGDLQASLKAFAAADAIMHVPTTGVELARAQADVGQLVEARDTALRVTRMPEQKGEPKPFNEAREQAADLNEELEGRIPSLKITVTGLPPGREAIVTLDGNVLPAEVLGQARKLDPGHHVVDAKSGKADAQKEVDLAEKDAKEVTLALTGLTAPVEPEEKPPETKPAETETPQPQRSGATKAMMLGGFSLAGVGVLVGAVTGFLTLSKTNDVKSQCVNATQCPPRTYGDIDSANSTATISTIAFAAAGVGAAVGVVGLIAGRPSAVPSEQAEKKEPSETSKLRWQPWIGAGAAGIRGTF